MTLTASLASPERPHLAWGLFAFLVLLPLHALLITILFGLAGLPAALVRVLAAWKELLIVVLFALAVLRTMRAPRAGTIVWLDLLVAALGVVSLAYLIGANVWFDTALPVSAELYGLRDTALVSLLYFVGRASPEVVGDRRFLRGLVVVGVVTSCVAIVERLVVTPRLLVLLGAARYVQTFLGAAQITTGNPYGLPDNYWTQMGGHLVQRAGSTYLSAQAFAISFLLIMPAATVWLARTIRHAEAGGGRAPFPALPVLAYTVLWAGLLLSVTRMTIAICAVQAIVVLLAQRRWNTLVTAGFVAATAATLACIFIAPVRDFLWDTLTWQSGSSASHLSDWSAGVDNFLARPLGAGLGSTDFVATRFGYNALAADNQLLRYGVELGVVGLLLHLAILSGAIATGVSAWLRRGRVGEYGLILATTTLGLAVNALSAVVFNAMILAYLFYWLTGAVTSAAQET